MLCSFKYFLIKEAKLRIIYLHSFTIPISEGVPKLTQGNVYPVKDLIADVSASPLVLNLEGLEVFT